MLWLSWFWKCYYSALMKISKLIFIPLLKFQYFKFLGVLLGSEFASWERVSIIERFGGKRALGVLRKSELRLNHSKFRMQFCLGALNNVLHVFLWNLLPFRNITYAKTLYLLSRQHVTPKTVISLKIRQNIDLSQSVSLKMLISG